MTNLRRTHHRSRTEATFGRRHPLALSISVLLLGAVVHTDVAAQAFPATVELSSLNGVTGFRIDGVATDDYSGRSVSAAGDINGDGVDDMIIGAYAADPNGSISGASYVVFGKRMPFASASPLNSLTGSSGFRIDGATADERSGISVSAAGDINGDGVDDLIIGASGAGPNGGNSGASYVVFGKREPFAATMLLNSLNGHTGFRIDGVAAGDYSGRSVNAAGDINGDGRDDLIIGAYGANANGSVSGASYVVFGSSTPFAVTLPLSSLNGGSGFRIDGVAALDRSGTSVSTAGDINGDGLDDLIIGASGADPNGSYSGASYVVFGRSTPFAATLALSSLNGGNGFRIDGIAAEDNSGYAVSAAGDVNGDGIDDLIIGASGADASVNNSGASYVVFGKNTPFGATLPLSSLNGTTGFRIDGVASGDGSGRSVSAAGDIDGDGVDDLIIGAYGADPSGGGSGASYVVFGKRTPFAPILPLSSLDGGNGFRMTGVAANDRFGVSVGAAGDINGDGVDDLIIGADGATPNGAFSGSSYVVFGRDTQLVFKSGFE